MRKTSHNYTRILSAKRIENEGHPDDQTKDQTWRKGPLSGARSQPKTVYEAVLGYVSKLSETKL